MTIALSLLGGFAGGCVFMALFAHKIATALANDLHSLGNRLQKL